MKLPLPTRESLPSLPALPALSALRKKDKAPAAAVTEPTFSAKPPRADLLPASVRARAADRRSRNISIAAVGALGVAIACVWGANSLTLSGLEGDLAEAEASTADLSTQVAVFAPVTNLATQTQALTATVDAQTADEVDHAQVLARFLAASAGVMDPTSVVVNTETSGACVPTDPFNTVPLAGCITFSGTDLTGTGAGETVRALSANEWFSDPFIPTVGTASETAGATLNGTVGLTVEAYTTDRQPAVADEGAAAAQGEPLPETTQD